MSAASADRPMRASDQDRHEAVLALTDHVAEGRLDHQEFERRMGAAQQATYLHELDPLFVDLPGSRAVAPARSVAPPGPWRPPFGARPPVFLPLLLAALVTVVVVLGGHVLWLLVPVWWLALGATGRRLRYAHGTRPAVAGPASARTATARRHHP